jgi:SAM-dependent methyltransferase
MLSDAQHWEDLYAQNNPTTLPWNAGGPDPDLVRLVIAGTIPAGQALDIGSGPGHDSVFLIQHGFNVIGIDISPSAVILARENASNVGLFGFFQEGDLRQIPVEDHFIDFANDRGCFHVLDPEDRPKAVEEVHRVLKKSGLYLLRVFSDKEPPGDGPHRFTRKELEDLFSSKFRILRFWEGIFEGSRKPKSYSMLMEKK